MLRGIQKLCGSRGLLQPYVTSYQLFCNYTMTKPNLNVHNLPKLPVPKLGDTLHKFLRSVRPHLCDEEFAVTSKLVKEFGAKDGLGDKLQAMLMKRAEQHANWLEDWWLNTAYLKYRDPLVVYSNPGLVFPLRDFKNQNEQLQYAAKTVLAALDYMSLIDSNRMPVEMMGKAPLDMGQYKKIFGTCRVPGVKQDCLSFNFCIKYMTVIHNNHIFHVDLWGADDVPLNEDQIVEQLKKVIEMSKYRTNEAIGILTTEHRDTWAEAYNKLIEDSVNKESLKDIERSVFVLCLDAAAGLHQCHDPDARRTLAGAQTIHGGGTIGNGGNRWYDKTIQFIVGADGVTGLTYEHSPAEGQPIAVMTDYIISYINQGKAENKRPSTNTKNPVLLKFKTDVEIQTMIKDAGKNLDRLVYNLDLNCFKYSKYGKDFIKSQKLSPDSYLQMAMQLAFYRLHKTPGAHYESAATRMYYGGRTETIRSCSVESIDFAKAMLNSKVSRNDKLAAMKKAIKGHKDYTVMALQGLGVDRHLLGLKLIAQENCIDLPPLYSDPGYIRSSHMRISTSQVACKCDGFMCYGPLVSDGYATCYNPRAADINFATAAFVKHPDTAAVNFRAALENSLQDMHDLLLHTKPSKL